MYLHIITCINMYCIYYIYTQCIKCHDVHCVVGRCSPQQTCSGRCNTEQSQRINVTVPNSVTIPCSDLLSSPNSTVDYCNYTNGDNEPLDTGVTTQYMLTSTEPSHHNNIIYCTNNQQIACYVLTAFCKEFVSTF